MGRLGLSCPARGVSPAAAEALRQRGVGALRGTTPAPARPALGLNLDRTRLVDVRAWANARGLACDARQRPSSVVTCTNVPLAAVWPGRVAGTIDELAFAFAPDGRLVAVDSLRRALSGAAASRLFDELARELAAVLGPGGERVGDSSAAYLRRGADAHGPPALSFQRLPRDGDRDEPRRPRRAARAVPVGAVVRSLASAPQRRRSRVAHSTLRIVASSSLK